MRKIETLMNQAVNGNANWTLDNTTVHFNEEENVSVVRLHNKIAEVGEDYMVLFDGGWQSVTTKSRLNALCDAFRLRRRRVSSRRQVSGLCAVWWAL